MELIGNFRQYINPEWIGEILNSRGMGRPAEGKTPDSVEEDNEYQRALAAGYKATDIYFYMFDKSNTSFDLNLPFIDKPYHWWITKMLPGNFMPMHTDPHTLYQKNSERYWMPWQDYQPGHIFLYENKMITDYKAGDLYRYSDSAALHGAANIGHVPRIILQISTYE